jgi:hypothetical protein
LSISKEFYRVHQKDNGAFRVHSYRVTTASGPLRNHLLNHHVEEWVKECQNLKIGLRGKEGEEAVARVTGVPVEHQAEARTPFTPDNFLDALVQFIVVTDQVFFFSIIFPYFYFYFYFFSGYKDCRETRVSPAMPPASP